MAAHTFMGTCPQCNAQPGTGCRSPKGHQVTPHKGRTLAPNQMGTTMQNQKIVVNKNVAANFRANSARAAYYAAICSHNGKTVGTFAKACAANPPSTPAKGKLAGKQEPVTGWVSWFVRNGYITLS